MKYVTYCFYVLLSLFVIFKSDIVYALNSNSSELFFSEMYRINDPYEEGVDRSWIDYRYERHSISSSSNNPNSSILQKDYNSGLGAKVRFRYYPKADKPVGSLGELYGVFPFSGKGGGTFVIGRKILNWNPSEKFWGMRKFHGKDNMELLGTEREGLIGVTGNFNIGSNFFVSVLLSPMSIPELNPDIDVKDGKVTSPMEWAKRPPPYTQVLEDNRVPNYYTLEMPPINDLILNPGAGLFSGVNIDRHRVSAYYMYKPEPTVRINAEGGLSEDLSRVDVPFWPFINYHQVYGADYQYFGKGWRANIGWEHVTPKHREAEGIEINYFKIKPTYFEESYIHAKTVVDISFLYKSTLSLNYLELVSSNIGVSDSFLDEPVRWQNAFGVGADLGITEWFRTLFDYRHDIKSLDRTLSAKARFTLFKHMFVETGAEIIWAKNVDSYWSMYRSNDTVFSNLGGSF